MVRFEGCWKAIMTDADAVILVYNPDAPSQDQQIMDWFEFFVRKNGLRDEQCMIFVSLDDFYIIYLFICNTFHFISSSTGSSRQPQPISRTI